MINREANYVKFLKLNRFGLLPRKGPPQQVIVVRAKITGLLPASELKLAGQTPLILDGCACIWRKTA